jgi:hypothetical protein
MTTLSQTSHRFSSLLKWTSILLCTGALMGCAGSRYGLEAASYSDVRVDARSLDLKVADARGVPAVDRAQVKAPQSLGAGKSQTVPVGLPQSFKLAAAERLGEIADGDGPKLQVVAEIEQAHLVFASRAQGDVAEIDVEITFSVYDQNGDLVQRGTTNSSGQVAADGATPDDFSAAVEATALNALDKYWAREKTVTALNRAIGTRG